MSQVLLREKQSTSKGMEVDLDIHALNPIYLKDAQRDFFAIKLSGNERISQTRRASDVKEPVVLKNWLIRPTVIFT